MFKGIRSIASLMLVVFAGAALAETISNWAAPSTWTPPGGMAARTGVKTGLATTYAAMPFIPVTPCRVIDTRGNGFTGEWGPPSMPGGTQRSFTIRNRCGIPNSASAVSFNFTVWAPVTGGDLRVFPAGDPTPTVSTLNWEAGILALANAAVVPLGTAGKITTQVDGTGTINLIVDVNGYYASDIADGAWAAFPLSSSNTNTIYATNSAPNGTAVFAGASGTNGSGVRGNASGTGSGLLGWNSSTGNGVTGYSEGGNGISGSSHSGIGVRGISQSAGLGGVLGENYSFSDGSYGTGGYSNINFMVYGVKGEVGPAATAGSAGVRGVDLSSSNDTSGVRGETDPGGANGATGIPTSLPLAGVRGEAGSSGVGVLGVSNNMGVRGARYTTSGGYVAGGAIGYASGFATYGVWGEAGSTGGTNWGVYAAGIMGASGTKSFVEPHPHKAGTVIRYVAMEGPEAGTYFRGRGRFAGGKAVIEVPESFRLVTDEEGLTVQITPIGRAAAAGVTRMGLDVIEAVSTDDVEFSFLVQGVRKTFRDWQVMVESGEFMPESPAARIPTYLSEKQKRNLIESGVYHEDGTVNMQTAERLGWAQEWREKAQLRPQAVSRAPQDPGPSPQQQPRVRQNP